MDYHLREHHEYEGDRAQADRLIGWLMDSDYWVEASQKSGKWTVVCGCAPKEIPSEIIRPLIQPK